VWLNNPRVPREASGTSGMTAAMNGALNLSTMDGWMLEFGKHKENSFLVPLVDQSLPVHEQDNIDRENLMQILEKDVIPTYYKRPERWFEMVQNSMTGVLEYFDSDRMATEYYEAMYS
jgi:starch phosphorylase